MEVQRNTGASHGTELGVAELILNLRGTHGSAVFEFYSLAADNRNPSVSLYAPVSISQEILFAEDMFRGVDEVGRVVLVLPYHGRCSSKPSGIATDRLIHYELINFLHVAGMNTPLHNVKHVGPGRRSKAWRMVSAEEIVIDGLWNSHARPLISRPATVFLHPVDCIHGAITADKEEPAYVILP